VTATYSPPECVAAASLRGRRLRLIEFGAAVNAMPQFGQKPDATIWV
jgi:hypothetical protein